MLRALIILVIVGLWLGISAVGGRTIGSLSGVTTNNQDVLLPREAESVEAREELKKFSDVDSLPALVVIQDPAVVDEAFGGRPTGGPPGTAFAEDLLKGVRVKDRPLTDYYTDDAAPHAFKASDDTGLTVIVPLSRSKLEAKDAEGDNSIAPAVDALRSAAQDRVPGAEVHVSGPAGFVADTGNAFAGIDGLLLLVALGAVLIILLIVYRSILLPLLVLLSSVAGLSLAGWIVYQLAESGKIIINGQAQGILFILVVGAATDYALLLVARHREELTRTDSTVTALTRAWRACLEPIAASAGTVALAMLCLLAADLNSSRYLGPVGAIAVGSALLVSMTFLPALLLLGRWVFWPRIPRPTPTHAADTTAEESHGLWGRIADGVARHPRRTWLIAAAVLALGAAFAPTLNAHGTTQSEIFLKQEDAVVGQRVLDEHYDLGASQPISIIVPTDKAEQAATLARAVEGVEEVTVGDDVQDGRVVVDAAAFHPNDAQQVVADIRKEVHPLAPGEVLVGGTEALRLDTNLTANRDLTVVIPLVLAMVLLVLTLLLRSVVAALLLTLANILSFATTMGIASLVFDHLFEFPGADPTVPLLGFVFLVALGVDYSIFLMSRAREEVGVHGPTHGVRRALGSTGSVITSAGVVLAATFAALAVIPLLFLVQLAFIVAFGVLLDTLIVRTLLVPGLSIDLGRWTWWPSRRGRRSVDHGQEARPTTT
ncbi:MMPL family transporter [Propionibacteriaceae bacterium Y1700]|uniref:MMPL family transporter n=1 Tax=Microlunatus sp. Y1700 TaxID=3418487 RepID=UPI003DA711BD